MIFSSFALIQPQMNVQIPKVRIPIKPLKTPPDSNEDETRKRSKPSQVTEDGDGEHPTVLQHLLAATSRRKRLANVSDGLIKRPSLPGPTR